MRADATHRFEFEVDGGKRPPFACLAGSRAEAEQIARNAGARVRLRSQVPMGHDDGDASARAHLVAQGLLRHPWRDDVLELVSMLDHVRLTGDAMSVVPVAFLPRSEILARGLRPCGCGRHGSERLPKELRAVEAPLAILVQMVRDGGWELHLQQRRERPELREILDWEPWPDHGRGALGIAFEPACSVWTIALEVLGTLKFAADLRPGELSAVAVAVGPGDAAPA